jgi:hypothetical protein
MTSPPTDIKGEENACVHRKMEYTLVCRTSMFNEYPV